MVAQLEFSNTVTVGSIIVAASITVASGLFTLRNNLRSFWRGLAEERAEQIESLEHTIKERDQKIHDLQEQGRLDLLKLAEEQRVLRHELKNELAAVNAQLAAERAKTDLTALIELLGHQHTEMMEQLKESH